MIPTTWRWNKLNVFACRGIFEAFASLLVPFVFIAYYSIRTALALLKRSRNHTQNVFVRSYPRSSFAALRRALGGQALPPVPPTSPAVEAAAPPTLPAMVQTSALTMKEVRKVVVILAVVAFLGSGYISRFALTMEETLMAASYILFG